MGEINSHRPVVMIVAAFSRYDEALDWGREQLEQRFGDVELASERFAFAETNYYDQSMGPGLRKQFWIFREPIDAGRLAEIKLLTNHLEDEYAALGRHGEPRPLNLDPGYLTMAKLVLASTKDHAHRIYLSQGIFAEVTLMYQHRGWRGGEFTFPDYQRADFHEFFTRGRQYVRQVDRQRREP